MDIRGYAPPAVTELGSLGGLTLMPNPPGKQGRQHDASQFQVNFSCVVDKTPGSDCSDNPAGGGGD